MMPLSEAAGIVNGSLHGADGGFSGVSIDSRQVKPGDLFVAIPGEKFDGHQYLSQAREQGAQGAVVSVLCEQTIPQIKVQDTTLALGHLASDWRGRFDFPVVAITGSNGKTTVTNMVASILSEHGPCLFPRNSFNNQWGVPLTLLRLKDQHQFAVIEMGTNHHGEIDYLTRIARPDIALVNNVSIAHSEGLGSVAEIARAKAEIFHGLKVGGVAILNADDPFFDYWKNYLSPKTDRSGFDTKEKPINIISFGSRDIADVFASDIQLHSDGSTFVLNGFGKRIDIEQPLPGKHNVINAAAAATVCWQCGVAVESIVSGLKAVKGVKGRLNILPGLNQSTIIDDSYNANPASIRAGIAVLSNFRGNRILVLGAMAELGHRAAELHQQIGEFARLKGIENLYCLESDNHDYAQYYAKGFGRACVREKDVERLVGQLKSNLNHNSTVMVKGSRSSQTERIVERIIKEPLIKT